MPYSLAAPLPIWIGTGAYSTAAFSLNARFKVVRLEALHSQTAGLLNASLLGVISSKTIWTGHAWLKERDGTAQRQLNVKALMVSSKTVRPNRSV